MFSILRNKQGNVIVMVTLAMMAIFGFAVLAIDVGNLYFNKAALQSMVDAASLAGAQDLRTGVPNTPFAERVFRECKTYINYNGKTGDNGTITLKDVVTPRNTNDTFTVTSPVTPSYTMNWHDWLYNGITNLAANCADWLQKLNMSNLAYACWPPTYDGSYTNRADTITIEASRTVKLAFAPVLGLAKETPVTAKSSAAIIPRARLNGSDAEKKIPIRPWGMLYSDFIDANGKFIANLVNFSIYDAEMIGTGIYGATYTIKVNNTASNYYSEFTLNGKTYKQNFIAVDFGKSTYLDNVQYGYTGPLNVGDTVTTNLSNMGDALNNAQPSFPAKDEPWDAIDYPTRPGRFVFIVPIISDPASPATGGQNVTIRGFAAFLLTKNPGSGGTIEAGLLEVTIEDPNKNNKLSLYGFGKWGITKAALTE